MSQPRSADVLLENATVVHHDRARAQPLGFTGGRVGNAARDALRLDLRGHAIFPGLINAHDHLQLNAIPPLAHGEPFANSYQWIEAFGSHRTREDVIAAVGVPSATRHRHGGLKNLLAGVTTVAHHDPWHESFGDSDFPVGVLRDFGWSHSLQLGERDAAMPPRYGPETGESFRSTPNEHPWIIHLAEGTDDIARDELSRLDAMGCLAANTVLVHGVGLSETDIGRVIERGASVVWCPASNLGMMAKTLHPRALFNAGRLALGTDSRLSGSRDLLDELRVAEAHSDLSASELLALVTAGAARTLRMSDVGGLDEGQIADCVIVREHAEPHRTLLEMRRSEIRVVVRGGAPLIGDPDFAEWFAHAGVDAVSVRLDGQPKLMARKIARPEVIALEPGLELG